MNKNQEECRAVKRALTEQTDTPKKDIQEMKKIGKVRHQDRGHLWSYLKLHSQKKGGC